MTLPHILERVAALALLIAYPATATLAQDRAASAATSEAAATQPQIAPANTQPDPAPVWTAALSGGIVGREGGPDGSWQSFSLTRQIGRGYVRGTAMRYHGTLLQADVALPSDYYVGTIGAGGNFGNWVVDGWASFGRQDYGRISTSSGSRASTGGKGSDYYAIGGDFGRVMPIGPALFLTPTLAGSFASGKLLRPAPTGTDLADLETDEPTWSASATLRLDHAFGPSGIHYAGLSISRNWTSNGISALRLRPSEPGNWDAPFALDSRHYADGWSEAGATASMKLVENLHLDLFATRSFGVKAGNVNSAGITLRRSF